MVFTGAVIRPIICDSDDAHIPDGAFDIVNDNDTMRFINADAFNSSTAGEHQTIIGVEFTELAVTDLHVQHDAAADFLINIRTDERQSCLTAHTAGTLEGKVAVFTGAEVQTDTLWTEHVLCLPLSFQLFSGSAVVEDAFKVHVEDDIGKVCNQSVIGGNGKIISIQNTHGLEEQCIVILLMESRNGFTSFGGSLVQMKAVDAIHFSGVADDCSCGQFINTVFLLRHLRHLLRVFSLYHIVLQKQYENCSHNFVGASSFCEGGTRNEQHTENNFYKKHGNGGR